MPLTIHEYLRGSEIIRLERARAASLLGARASAAKADKQALHYAPYIEAAVSAVGETYWGVARWLTQNGVPTPRRRGRWSSQGVKNMVVRYERLTSTRLIRSLNVFPVRLGNSRS
jgi:hypothetical protein